MSKRKNPFAWLGAPYYLWAAVFIIIPLLLVVWYGLTDSTGAFTFENVAAILNPAHSKALLLSILLSLAATGVCLLLAYPLCMCRGDIALKNFEYIYYSTPNTAAIDLMDADERNNPVLFPDLSQYHNLEAMKYLGKDGDRLYFDLWKEVKSAF